jgi:SAM-dependent methyltransferase
VLDANASVLVICGGNFDRDTWRGAGFTNVTISNLSPSDTECRVDAENIPYDANAFDVVAVHAGLHHCYSPHRALLEMYRVARKGVIVVESRDSLAMRIAGTFGLVPDYELEALVNLRAFGGVANSAIPNFVYRWTKHEVEKTICSGDPVHRHVIRHLYGLRLPLERFCFSGKAAVRALFYRRRGF